MRLFVAVGLFAAIAAALAVSQPGVTVAQEKKDEKKAQPKFDPPKAVKPDEATLKTIAEKTEQLRKAVAALKEKKLADDVLIEVEIHLKAAENIVRFAEWYNAASGKWALTTLDQGLARAKQAEGGKPVWRDAPGKWVVRAYRSNIDNSIQPYAVVVPADYGQPGKKFRYDIVLHGRDSSLTEAKFISSNDGKAGAKDLDHVELQVYGRGNNAYRWAGEEDVFEAAFAFRGRSPKGYSGPLDNNRWVLRGFSMGGAGTWHLGLHHPARFCVIGPGAGFTSTHGYIANLPKELPDHQEKCLRIYDAVAYAENAFNVPVVAYSGEKDAQKKAADNIENALKGFKEPLRFTHLVAPGLEHQMPKEWQDKADAEYRKYSNKGRNPEPERVRFVTYTTKYGKCDWVTVEGLDASYEKATVDATRKDGAFVATTANVRRLSLWRGPAPANQPVKVTIDGQVVDLANADTLTRVILEKVGGKWTALRDTELRKRLETTLEKRTDLLTSLTGPIDDAFMSPFVVVKPELAGFHTGLDKFTTATADQFAGVWDKYFRGQVQLAKYDSPPSPRFVPNAILFGDPESNPLIAKVLPKLPITWTKDKLVVNGVEYDPKTHVPVLIYPNPFSPDRYVVINSGHTFKEADLKGTNAQLYPRLGDWAVIKPTPTDKDPAAHEVVAAGLFDENWQFPKKK